MEKRGGLNRQGDEEERRGGWGGSEQREEDSGGREKNEQTNFLWLGLLILVFSYDLGLDSMRHCCNLYLKCSFCLIYL